MEKAPLHGALQDAGARTHGLPGLLPSSLANTLQSVANGILDVFACGGFMTFVKARPLTGRDVSLTEYHGDCPK